jgi:glycosyltransferase involved in cell wall biosynthesis
MNHAPVSVVIPSYNAGPLVVQAVDSVLGQTLPPAEVLVIDDGSTDDTRARLAPYGDRLRYVYQANGGVAAARNHGVRLASQEFVAFLDADDVWHPRKLELQVPVLQSRPDFGLLGTGMFDWPADVLPDLGPDPAPAVLPVPVTVLVIKNYIGTSSVLARRAVLEQIGPFDTALQGPEDYDLWLRIAEVARVGNLDLPLAGYRMVQGSLSKAAARMQVGVEHILHKLDARGTWKGRWLLRRKAYSYACYANAYLHREAGELRAALRQLVRSFAWYPLPYRRCEVRMALARVRMLGQIVRRSLRPAPAGSPQRGLFGAGAVPGAAVVARPSEAKR